MQKYLPLYILCFYISTSFNSMIFKTKTSPSTNYLYVIVYFFNIDLFILYELYHIHLIIFIVMQCWHSTVTYFVLFFYYSSIIDCSLIFFERINFFIFFISSLKLNFTYNFITIIVICVTIIKIIFRLINKIFFIAIYFT